MGAAQLHPVADDRFQLILFGVARQQGHLDAGLGGAGVARLHRELHQLIPEPGDGGGIFHGFAVAEDHFFPQFGPHDPGQMVGVLPPQHSGAVGNLGGKITVRHITVSLY